MQTQLKPWTGSERLYFYPQSAQIVGQTGQIGRLRIDFGRQGNEFYSTWEDSRLSLKSDKFRQQFDDIINDLRFGDGGRPLAGRKELTGFLRDKQAAILPEDGEWHGFRIDSDLYTFLLRCKPSPGDYEAYVWCYKKDWLDEHMANAEKGDFYLRLKICWILSTGELRDGAALPDLTDIRRHQNALLRERFGYRFEKAFDDKYHSSSFHIS